MINEKGLEVITGRKYKVIGRPGKYILASVTGGKAYLVPDVGATQELEKIDFNDLRRS